MEIKLTVKDTFNDIQEYIYQAKDINEAICKMCINLGSIENLDVAKEIKWVRTK